MKQQSSLIKFDGLGTHWECEILDENISVSRLKEIEVACVCKLNEFEKLYSRFNDASLVWMLNTKHEILNPPVEMCKMMRFARKMSEITDGAFDISIGGKLSADGYGERSHENNVCRDFWKKTKISAKIIEIPENSTIDFGGFGKGWLIDELANLFAKFGISQFIINGGGDLYVHAESPIEIILEHPIDNHRSIGQTKISNGALAASSIIKRSWSHNGLKVHHIIDPHNGKSVDNGVIGTFVKADSALIADVMATVLIVRPDLEKELADKLNLKTIILNNKQLINS